MGNLLNRKNVPQFHVKKIAVMGLKGAGKTAVMNWMKRGESQEDEKELEIERIIYNGVELLVYQLAESNQMNQRKNIIEADAVIFVVDSSNEGALWQVKEEFTSLSKQLQFSDTIVLVLFNKQDNENAMELSQLIFETGVHQEIEQDVFLHRCSAKTGEGMKDALDKLVNYIRHRDDINRLLLEQKEPSLKLHALGTAK